MPRCVRRDRTEQHTSVAETRWTSGVTREDRTRNECVRGRTITVA